VTITGGKWTTYRRMAEDTINAAVEIGALQAGSSVTSSLPIHGYMQPVNVDTPSYYYGSDAYSIEQLVKEDPLLGELIHTSFPNRKAEIVWAVKEEMCMTIEDFLARRSRMLFLDAKASVEAASIVAAQMADLMKMDENWITKQVDAYRLLAKNYLPRINSVTT